MTDRQTDAVQRESTSLDFEIDVLFLVIPTTAASAAVLKNDGKKHCPESNA